MPSGLELWILSGVTRGDILGDSPTLWVEHSQFILSPAKFGANAILGVSLAVCKAEQLREGAATDTLQILRGTQS